MLAIVFGMLLVLLLIVLGVQPQLSSRSRFALQRHAAAGDGQAALLLRRHQMIRDLFSLQRVVAALLLVLISFVAVELFHWAIGLLVSVVIALESGALARVSLWQPSSQKLYERYEGRMLQLMERHPRIFRAIRSVAPVPNDAYDIESKEELLEMIEKSGDALGSHEKKLLINSLKFDSVTVKDVMTPRSVVETISHDEVLGPLVLNDLYKTGHSRFPVVGEDVDHIVGVLYVRDLLVVNSSTQSQKVSQLMDEEVCFIHEEQDLAYALKAFIRTEKLLFVVVNSYRETVGIITLEDVIEALLGQKITDEFEHHTDLRAVAEKNERRNNTAGRGVDV